MADVIVKKADITAILRRTPNGQRAKSIDLLMNVSRNMYENYKQIQKDLRKKKKTLPEIQTYVQTALDDFIDSAENDDFEEFVYSNLDFENTREGKEFWIETLELIKKYPNMAATDTERDPYDYA